MPVAVVSAEGHHRSGRPDRVEEPLGVGRPAVVWDLEHIGVESPWPVQQRLLGEHVAVTGQQHAAVAAGDAQHHRAAVALGIGPHPRRRCQHLDDARAQREAHARVDADHRYGAGAGDADRFNRTVGQRMGRGAGTGGHEQRGHVDPP